MTFPHEPVLSPDVCTGEMHLPEATYYPSYLDRIAMVDLYQEWGPTFPIRTPKPWPEQGLLMGFWYKLLISGSDGNPS